MSLTPQDIEILEKHLPHELGMLEHAYALLNSEGEKNTIQKFPTGIEERVNNQISHLNYERGIVHEPLTGTDIWVIKEKIDHSVEQFEARLTKEARGHWKIRDANTIELGESFYSAATNNIQVIMTKIGDIDQGPRL